METKVDNKKYSITFRDSSKLFPEALAKVTKDFDVTHKKLPETVNHKQIAHFMRESNFNVDALLLKFPKSENTSSTTVLDSSRSSTASARSSGSLLKTSAQDEGINGASPNPDSRRKRSRLP